MYHKILFYCCLFIPFAPIIKAQNPDSLPTYTTPTVELSAASINLFSIDNQLLITKNNAALAQANLGTLLQSQSNFFVKQYGLGGLNTVSHRGGTASQTQIFWEGINVQNPMLGQTDLSLQPLFFIDQVQIQTQAASALAGSASIGGNLYLTNQTPDTKFKINILYSIGQFNQHKLGFGLSYGKNKWAAQTRLWGLAAKNDFIFRDINAFGQPKPLVNMPHNQQTQSGILQEIYLKLAPKSRLELKIWALQSQRQLPPTLLQSSNDETQADKTFRAVAKYEYLNPVRLSKFILRQAFINENLSFTSAAVNSKAKFYNLLTEASYRQYFGAHLLESTAQYNYLRAENGSGYAENPSQQRANLALFYRFSPSNKPLIINVLSRVEHIFALRTLAAASAAISYKIKSFQLNFSLSQNYRLPTFNDLFWQVGGNPLLKAEKTSLAEANFKYQYQPKSKKISFDIKISPYLAIVRDQIVWLPDPNTNLWAVVNIANTTARGAQMQANARYIFNPKFEISTQQQYTFSRINDAQTPDNQLLYSPKHNYTAHFQALLFQNFSLQYQQVFTAKRYLDNSNNSSAPAYAVANIFANYQLNTTNYSALIGFNIYNIYNHDYQVMPNRPMPLRWCELSLRLSFEQPTAK